jgi:hypothetical protein
MLGDACCIYWLQPVLVSNTVAGYQSRQEKQQYAYPDKKMHSCDS